MATTTNLTMTAKGLTMSVSGSALANKLLPHLISALSTNATLRNAIVNAIMPAVRQQAAATAQTTAGGKSNKP